MMKIVFKLVSVKVNEKNHDWPKKFVLDGKNLHISFWI